MSQATAWPIVVIRRLGEGVRQKDIAEELGIEAPSLVRLLDQLEASGLAVRKLDPEDGRSKTLYLTDAGRRIANEIDERLLGFRRMVFNGVSKEDADAFLRVLDTIRHSTCTAGRSSGKHSGNHK
ncbi:MarR family winged helix-turn-helix transcriptional regulator [Advenella kashmirensis]|nr:MarR family transcriptional regulator [Advenella kashmirensis]